MSGKTLQKVHLRGLKLVCLKLECSLTLCRKVNKHNPKRLVL